MTRAMLSGWSITPSARSASGAEISTSRYRTELPCFQTKDRSKRARNVSWSFPWLLVVKALVIKTSSQRVPKIVGEPFQAPQGLRVGFTLHPDRYVRCYLNVI